MIDRYDITTIRRSIRLAQESENGLNFSVLNTMVFILVLAIAAAGIKAMFS